VSEIVMPRLSDTMEEGTVLRWLKREGEEVRRGEELVEIETDKATMAYEADREGVLEILAREGDTLPVGAPIARIGEGEPAPKGGPAGVRAVGEPAEDGGSYAPPAPAEVSPAVSEGSPGTRGGAPVAPGVSQAAPDGSPAADGGRVKASPLARRLARARGVDLHALEGSGPGGRIVKADVDAAGSPGGVGLTGEGAAGAGVPPSSPLERSASPRVSAGTAASTPPPPSTGTLPDVARAKGETTTVELTRTQQTIARRMAESKATIPHFALHAEVDMEECVRLRGELKRVVQPHAPTYNDMVVKASALALREHPRANGSYRDGQVQLHARVNVGVAVAVEGEEQAGDAGALIVPTVFDADQKSLGEIARETRALARRVREGTITPPELGGGTFTVSNLGMYGITSFTAIVNPPQAAILSVGALAPRPGVRDGEVVARHTMTITLACDHRILYGADAARFLARIRELLERPAALTL
jgi:pyruvate dehydrogenase E2 component (dihydrolipoamide acetyltransferase)